MVTNISLNSDDFFGISLSKIPCNRDLASAVYVKVNEKFIKFKEAGDHIPEDKYNYFISMNVRELFVLKESAEIFLNSISNYKKAEIAEKVLEVGESNRTIVEKFIDIRETVYEAFLDEALSNETVENLKNQVIEFVATVKHKNPQAELFAKLSSLNNTIAEHSLNVANLALLFGMASGQTHLHVLENLYLGALFHDYGKAKIPASILDKPVSFAYEKAMSEHPEAGVELLKKNGLLSKPVLSIVLEHHEQFGGVGFPKGLQGDAIYGLTKIVSIANVFDNICMSNRGKSSMYKNAIKVIEYDNGKQFDPNILPRIIDVLKLGYGGYVRTRERKELT